MDFIHFWSSHFTIVPSFWQYYSSSFGIHNSSPLSFPLSCPPSRFMFPFIHSPSPVLPPYSVLQLACLLTLWFDNLRRPLIDYWFLDCINTLSWSDWNIILSLAFLLLFSLHAVCHHPLKFSPLRPFNIDSEAAVLINSNCQRTSTSQLLASLPQFALDCLSSSNHLTYIAWLFLSQISY